MKQTSVDVKLKQYEETLAGVALAMNMFDDARSFAIHMIESGVPITHSVEIINQFIKNGYITGEQAKPHKLGYAFCSSDQLRKHLHGFIDSYGLSKRDVSGIAQRMDRHRTERERFVELEMGQRAKDEVNVVVIEEVSEDMPTKPYPTGLMPNAVHRSPFDRL